MSPLRRALPHPVRWALVRHGAGIAVAAIAIMGLTFWHSDRLARTEARAVAEAETRAVAATIVAPLQAADLDSGAELARARLAAIVHAQPAASELLRVKVWRPVGAHQAMVVYSDDPAVEGTVHPAGERAALFGTTDALVESHHSERYADEDYGPEVLEVYVAFTDRQGRPFLFEAYIAPSSAGISRTALLADWLPLVFGSLVLLALTTLPLSIHLARRVDAIARDREQLALGALRAAEAERRRLAEELHDGLVQDLAGAALALDAVRDDRVDPEVAPLLRGTRAVLSSEVRTLRRMIDELFPPAEPADLAAALAPHVEALERSGVEVTVDIAEEIDERTADLVQRLIGEALRNVHKHAEAEHAAVRLRVAEGWLRATVTDDGRGFTAARSRPGHIGLRMIDVAARAAGGRAAVRSGPQGGTRVEIELPHRAAALAAR